MRTSNENASITAVVALPIVVVCSATFHVYLPMMSWTKTIVRENVHSFVVQLSALAESNLIRLPRGPISVIGFCCAYSYRCRRRPTACMIECSSASSAPPCSSSTPTPSAGKTARLSPQHTRHVHIRRAFKENLFSVSIRKPTTFPFNNSPLLTVYCLDLWAGPATRRGGSTLCLAGPVLGCADSWIPSSCR